MYLTSHKLIFFLVFKKKTLWGMSFFLFTKLSLLIIEQSKQFPNTVVQVFMKMSKLYMETKAICFEKNQSIYSQK